MPSTKSASSILPALSAFRWISPRPLALFRKAADLDQPEALFNVAGFIDDGHVPDAGPDEAAAYLYRAIRLGSEKVLEALTEQSQSFKPETRKACKSS